ncbi:MAG TPA: DUF5667 domain-containing protein [Micromonosporaceae bacterium]
MSASLFDRRRAERFADLLAQPPGHPRHRRTDLDAGLTELVALAGQVGAIGRETATPAPDEEFRTGLRALVTATIQREGLGRTASIDSDPAQAALAGKTQLVRQVPTPGTVRARLAILIGVLVALGLSGVSMASSNALPGNPLYQVKRSQERAQVALAGSDLSRGQLLLELARTRLNEARRVGEPHRGRVLTDMNTHTRNGATLLLLAAVQHHDPENLNVVLRFVAQQRERLDAVNQVSVQRSGSLDVLDDIEQRAQQLRSGLDHDCGMDGMDELGPVPLPCH